MPNALALLALYKFWLRGDRRRLGLRTVACVLVASFLAAEVAQAAPLSSPAPSAVSLASDPSRFEPPLPFASLREVHRGTGPFVIHIQDAHSNLSGQENLAWALDAIMEKYDVRLVLVEGGSRDATLTPIKSIASPETWKRVAKSFLVEGKISGEEYLNLISDKPMKIVGVEDKALYFKSVSSYADLAAVRTDALEYLSRVRTAIEKMKRRLYPRELLAFEARAAAAGGEADFRAALELLAYAGIDASGYPSLARLGALEATEKEIDFERANLEQGALAEEIARRGGGSELRASLERMGNAKGAALSRYPHFRNTFVIAREKGIRLEDYPALSKYVDYLRAFSEIDLDAVLKDAAAAREACYAKLLAGDAPRKLRAIDRYVALLDTAFRIRMSAEEFEAFRANETDFATASYLAFVNRLLAEAGAFEDLVPYRDALEKAKTPLEAFYDSVRERDFAFVRNTSKALAAEKESVAILITGGYHTPHLKKLLREDGFSYAVLTPAVSTETNQAKYEELLLAPLRKKPAAAGSMLPRGTFETARKLPAAEFDWIYQLIDQAKQVETTRFPGRATAIESKAALAALGYATKTRDADSAEIPVVSAARMADFLVGSVIGSGGFASAYWAGDSVALLPKGWYAVDSVGRVTLDEADVATLETRPLREIFPPLHILRGIVAQAAILNAVNPGGARRDLPRAAGAQEDFSEISAKLVSVYDLLSSKSGEPEIRAALRDLAAALRARTTPVALLLEPFGTREEIESLARQAIDAEEASRLIAQWPAESRVHLFKTLARTLRHVHSRGVAHRDVKPSNFWFPPSYFGPRAPTPAEIDARPPVLHDFGVSLLEGDGLSRAKLGVESVYGISGTPGYMPTSAVLSFAEEVPLNPYDADLFALGVSIAQMSLVELGPTLERALAAAAGSPDAMRAWDQPLATRRETFKSLFYAPNQRIVDRATARLSFFAGERELGKLVARLVRVDLKELDGKRSELFDALEALEVSGERGARMAAGAEPFGTFQVPAEVTAATDSALFGKRSFKITTSAGRQIFLSDHHHKALPFWLEARRTGLIGNNSTLLHVDRHPDDLVSKRAFAKPVDLDFLPPVDVEDPAQLAEAIRGYEIDDFIAPLVAAGLIDAEAWFHLAEIDDQVLPQRLIWDADARPDDSPFHFHYGLEKKPLEDVLSAPSIDIVDVDLDFFMGLYERIRKSHRDAGIDEPRADRWARDAAVQRAMRQLVPIVARGKIVSIVTSPEFIDQTFAMELMKSLLAGLNAYDSSAPTETFAPTELEYTDILLSEKGRAGRRLDSAPEGVMDSLPSVEWAEAEKIAAGIVAPAYPSEFEPLVGLIEKTNPRWLVYWKLASAYRLDRSAQALKTLLGLYKNDAALPPFEKFSLYRFISTDRSIPAALQATGARMALGQSAEGWKPFLLEALPGRELALLTTRTGRQLRVDVWDNVSKHADGLQPVMSVYASDGMTDAAGDSVYGLRGFLIRFALEDGTQLRGAGLFRALLNRYFEEYPEVTRTHPDMRNLIAMDLLLRDYGFIAPPDAAPNAYLSDSLFHMNAATRTLFEKTLSGQEQAMFNNANLRTVSDAELAEIAGRAEARPLYVGHALERKAVASASGARMVYGGQAPAERLRGIFSTPQPIKWSGKGGVVGATIEYDRAFDVYVVTPDAATRKAYTGLAALDARSSQEDIGPRGSFGQIQVKFETIDGRSSAIFDEMHPSLGYRLLRPTSVRNVFRPWIENAIAEMVRELRAAGIESFYASNSGRIAKRYPKIPRVNLWENYEFAFRKKGWEPVTVLLNGESAELWRLPASGVRMAFEASSDDIEDRWVDVWEKNLRQNRQGSFDTYPPAVELFIENGLRAYWGTGEGRKLGDIGAGADLFLSRVMTSRFPGASITAVDIFEMDREGEPPSRIDFRRGSAESTGFVDGELDAALYSFSYDYADRDAAAAELLRALKPGGRAVLALHHPDSDYTAEATLAAGALQAAEDFCDLLKAHVERGDFAAANAKLLERRRGPLPADPARALGRIETERKKSRLDAAIFSAMLENVFASADEASGYFASRGFRVVSAEVLPNGDKPAAYGIVLEKLETAQAGPAGSSNFTTFAGRLRRVDDFLASEIVPALAARARAERRKLQIYDIGVGYPPVTTLEMAKKISEIVPRGAFTVKGVDIVRPAVVVSAKRSGLLANQDVGPLSFTVTVEAILFDAAGNIVALDTSSGVILAGDVVPRTLTEASVYAARVRGTARGRFSEILTRFLGRWLPTSVHSRWPVVASPWNLFSRNGVSFIRADYRTAALPPADLVRVFNVPGPENREALAAALREGGALVAGFSPLSGGADMEKLAVFRKRGDRLVPEAYVFSTAFEGGEVTWMDRGGGLWKGEAVNDLVSRQAVNRALRQAEQIVHQNTRSGALYEAMYAEATALLNSAALKKLEEDLTAGGLYRSLPPGLLRWAREIRDGESALGMGLAYTQFFGSVFETLNLSPDDPAHASRVEVENSLGRLRELFSEAQDEFRRTAAEELTRVTGLPTRVSGKMMVLERPAGARMAEGNPYVGTQNVARDFTQEDDVTQGAVERSVQRRLETRKQIDVWILGAGLGASAAELRERYGPRVKLRFVNKERLSIDREKYLASLPSDVRRKAERWLSPEFRAWFEKNQTIADLDLGVPFKGRADVILIGTSVLPYVQNKLELVAQIKNEKLRRGGELFIQTGLEGVVIEGWSSGPSTGITTLLYRLNNRNALPEYEHALDPASFADSMRLHVTNRYPRSKFPALERLRSVARIETSTDDEGATRPLPARYRTIYLPPSPEGTPSADPVRASGARVAAEGSARPAFTRFLRRTYNAWLFYRTGVSATRGRIERLLDSDSPALDIARPVGEALDGIAFGPGYYLRSDPVVGAPHYARFRVYRKSGWFRSSGDQLAATLALRHSMKEGGLVVEPSYTTFPPHQGAGIASRFHELVARLYPEGTELNVSIANMRTLLYLAQALPDGRKSPLVRRILSDWLALWSKNVVDDPDFDFPLPPREEETTSHEAYLESVENATLDKYWRARQWVLMKEILRVMDESAVSPWSSETIGRSLVGRLSSRVGGDLRIVTGVLPTLVTAFGSKSAAPSGARMANDGSQSDGIVLIQQALATLPPGQAARVQIDLLAPINLAANGVHPGRFRRALGILVERSLRESQGEVRVSIENDGRGLVLGVTRSEASGDDWYWSEEALFRRFRLMGGFPDRRQRHTLDSGWIRTIVVRFPSQPAVLIKKWDTDGRIARTNKRYAAGASGNALTMTHRMYAFDFENLNRYLRKAGIRPDGYGPEDEVLFIGPYDNAEDIVGFAKANPRVKTLHVVEPDTQAFNLLERRLHEAGLESLTVLGYRTSVLSMPALERVTLVYDKYVFAEGWFSPGHILRAGREISGLLGTGAVHVSAGQANRFPEYPDDAPMKRLDTGGEDFSAWVKVSQGARMAAPLVLRLRDRLLADRAVGAFARLFPAFKEGITDHLMSFSGDTVEEYRVWLEKGTAPPIFVLEGRFRRSLAELYAALETNAVTAVDPEAQYPEPRESVRLFFERQGLSPDAPLAESARRLSEIWHAGGLARAESRMALTVLDAVGGPDLVDAYAGAEGQSLASFLLRALDGFEGSGARMADLPAVKTVEEAEERLEKIRLEDPVFFEQFVEAVSEDPHHDFREDAKKEVLDGYGLLRFGTIRPETLVAVFKLDANSGGLAGARMAEGRTMDALERSLLERITVVRSSDRKVYFVESIGSPVRLYSSELIGEGGYAEAHLLKLYGREYVYRIPRWNLTFSEDDLRSPYHVRRKALAILRFMEDVPERLSRREGFPAVLVRPTRTIAEIRALLERLDLAQKIYEDGSSDFPWREIAEETAARCESIRSQGESQAVVYRRFPKGGTLRDAMEDPRWAATPLARKVELLGLINVKLNLMHRQGVVHRDLKPENLWVSEEFFGSGRFKTIVADFGLAIDLNDVLRRRNERRSLAVPGGSMGTPGYYPEDFEGRALNRDFFTQRMDEFAWGVTICEVLFGIAPPSRVGPDWRYGRAADHYARLWKTLWKQVGAALRKAAKDRLRSMLLLRAAPENSSAAFPFRELWQVRSYLRRVLSPDFSEPSGARMAERGPEAPDSDFDRARAVELEAALPPLVPAGARMAPDVEEILWRLNTKYDFKVLAEGGPIRSAAFFALAPDAEAFARLTASGRAPRAYSPILATSTERFESVVRDIAEGRRPAMVFKPDSLSIGKGVFFLERRAEGGLWVTFAADSANNQEPAEEFLRLRGVQVDVSNDTFRAAVEERHGIEETLAGLRERLSVESYRNSALYYPGMMEVVVPAIKVLGNAYETRHTVKGNLSGGDPRVQSDPERVYGRVGSSSYFSNYTGRDRAYVLEPSVMFDPLNITPTRRPAFVDHVDELLEREFLHFRNRLAGMGITGDMEVEMQFDLMWLEPETDRGFPIPVLIEGGVFPSGARMASPASAEEASVARLRARAAQELPAAQNQSPARFLGALSFLPQADWETGFGPAFEADPALRVLFSKAVVARSAEGKPFPMEAAARSRFWRRDGDAIVAIDRATLEPAVENGRPVRFVPAAGDLEFAREALRTGSRSTAAPAAISVDAENDILALLARRRMRADSVRGPFEAFLAANPPRAPFTVVKDLSTIPYDAANPAEFETYAAHFAASLVEVSRLSAAASVTFRVEGDAERLRRFAALPEAKALVSRGALVETTPVDPSTGEAVREILLGDPKAAREGRAYLPEAPFAAGENADFRAFLLLVVFAGSVDPASPPESFLRAYRTLLGEEAAAGFDERVLRRFLSGDVSAEALALAVRYALRPVEKIDWTRLVQFYDNVRRMVQRSA